MLEAEKVVRPDERRETFTLALLVTIDGRCDAAAHQPTNKPAHQQPAHRSRQPGMHGDE